MRVLASADLHGVERVYDWLLDEARRHRVEALVLAGDLLGCLDGFDTPESAQRHEASIVTARLDAAGVPVFYIMGNDDLVELDARTGQVQSIHGRRVTAGPFNLVGYQYSLPFMGGTFEKPEPGIEADLATLKDLLDPRTVFVSHSPALGILDPGFGESRIGSSSLRAFLEAHPFLLHVHGHSHGGFGRAGKHLNVASGGQARAMLVDLATRHSQVLGMDHGRVSRTEEGSR